MGVYETLQVKPIINAIGTFTRLGGTLMPPEVLAAMNEAAQQFVCIEDLQYRAGNVIAEMTGAEAAYITSGAQASLVLSIAACITGLDAEKMDQMPHTDRFPGGMKNEVIMARAHRNHYDHAVETAGGHIVEVGDANDCRPDEIAAAITDKTAAILYLPWPDVPLALADVVAVGREHGIPVVVDGAGRLDTPENLRAYIAAGADLVVYSGGKYIRGPQASGFVCGRRDLITIIAWQHLDMDAVPRVWTAPRELVDPEQVAFMPRQGVGRGYKAGKEEIVGLVTALRLYVARDHAAERQRCERQLQTILDGLADLPHVVAEWVDPASHRGALPLARIHIDRDALGMTGYDFIWALKTGDPSIHPMERELEQDAVIIHPFGLQPGDEDAIVRRVREIVM
jgi:L-seryl-tRNA(Ser) seleniumtransferase